MAETDTPGRPNQRRRTRKDLLRAASRLTQQGIKPTLEEVAEEAMVSRATAYRYFPGVEALLLEAALDVATPEAEALFAGDAPADPVDRLLRVDEALDAMIRANEPGLRLFLARSLEHSVTGAETGVPGRQNRRTPLIEAALEPARGRIDPATYDRLVQVLGVLIGTEGRVVFKDVLQVEDADAAAAKHWAIAALVAAALRD